jgi:hypothetical protein
MAAACICYLCDEGDGLTFCELLQGYDYSHCHFCSEVFIWRFLWNLIVVICSMFKIPDLPGYT